MYEIISVLGQSAIVLDFDVLELHENDQVSPSHRVTLIDVLDQIEEKIAAKMGLS